MQRGVDRPRMLPTEQILRSNSVSATSRLFVIAVVHCAITEAVLFAQSHDDTNSTAIKRVDVNARVALDAMTLSMRAVQSGTCRIQCEYQYDPNELGQGRNSQTAEYIFIAFDKNTGMTRYDFLEMPNSGLPNQLIVRPGVILSVAASWKEGGPNHPRFIVRRLPNDATESLESLRDPFATVIAGCMANKLAHVNTAVLDRFLDITVPKSDIISFEHVRNDRVKVAVRYKSTEMKATIEYELTLDPLRGYVPVRKIMRHDATKTGEMAPPDVMEADWESLNGVYVPTRIQCSGSAQMKSELKFILNWEHVNETLSSELFSEEAFALKRGDLVVVAGGDQLAVEKIVGVELPKLPVKQPDPPPRRWQFALFLLANALAFGGWLYFLRRRRLASRKS